MVVMTLKNGGKKRYGELKRELRGVSQKRRSPQPLLEAICQWSERRLPEVEQARALAGADPFDCGA